MLEVNGLPREIVIYKSGANTAGIKVINKMHKGFVCPILIEMERRKYLNSIIVQDRHSIKRSARPILGFKAYASATAALSCIEIARMIRKNQFAPGLCPFYQFAELAA